MFYPIWLLEFKPAENYHFGRYYITWGWKHIFKFISIWFLSHAVYDVVPEAQSRTLLEILNSESNYVLGYKNTEESSTGQPVKNFAGYSQLQNSEERIGDPFLDYDEDLEINL